MNQTIGFIGGGNMATSLIGGLITNKTVSAQQILLFEPNADKAQQLNADFGIHIAQDNQHLVETSDVVIIAVKPQVLKTVLSPLATAFQQKKPLIISVVAGITVASIEQWLSDHYAVVRVMPNTPSLVGAGASGLYSNANVTSTQRDFTSELMKAVGVSAWVNNEEDIDNVTALSGSGPAYFMLFIQSLIEAGVAAGLDEQTAKKLAVNTASGAAALIESSDLPIQTLIENVTSPGGTTEQALNSLHQSNLPEIVKLAFDAAKQRSMELAKELG